MAHWFNQRCLAAALLLASPLATNSIYAETTSGVTPMHSARSAIHAEPFGKTSEGVPVELYTLTNKHGAQIKVTTYGAVVTQILMPDKQGKIADIALGFDNVKQYEEKTNPYFGAMVGRVANRIAQGTFELDGKKYQTPKNNGENTLHGGVKGFNSRVWRAHSQPGSTPSVRFTYHSPDGEEGFPGNMDAAVTYTLTDDNELKIDYEATTDKATPINLTNHSYFNLAGAGNGTVLAHDMMIKADHYTPVNDKLIPTGQIAPVEGTPFDFRKSHPIGEHINEVKSTPVGYDHNFVLGMFDKQPLSLAARAHDPKSGRTMEVWTTQPGIQFYTGNFLDGTVSGIGGAYPQYAAFCLETQHFPDSIHHPNFPNSVLKPGEVYQHTTVYKFSAE